MLVVAAVLLGGLHHVLQGLNRWETAFTPRTSLWRWRSRHLAAMLLMIFGRVLGTAGLLAGLLAPSSGSTFACDGAVLLSMVNGPLAPLALPRNSRSAEQDSYGSAPPAERMSTSGTQRRGPVPGPGAWA